MVKLPFAPAGGLRLEGRAAIEEHFLRAVQAPMKLQPCEVRIHRTTDPEVVIAEYDYQGSATRTGRTFVVSNVQILRVRRGRIITSRDVHGHAAMAVALSGGEI